MADLSQVQIDFTYKDIIKWDRDTTRQNYKDPVMRPLIDEVLRRHEASKSTPPAAAAPTRETEYQAAAVKKEVESAEAIAKELERFQNLPREKQIEEVAKLAADRKARDERSEKVVVREQIATERENNYLNAIGENFPTAKARDLEVARRKQERADKIAVAEAEAEAAAQAVQAEADAKAAAEAQALVDAEATRVAEKAVADKAEADRVAAEAAEVAAKAEAEAAALRPKQKKVFDFQAKDEHGNPIGRRTHLVYETNEELIEQMKTAYENALRYAERMKKRATSTASPEPVVPEVLVMNEEDRATVQKDLESKDITKILVAKQLLETDDANRARKADLDPANPNSSEFKRREAVSGEFLKRHPEFVPCQSNANQVKDYMDRKNLPFTLDNLEDVFEVLESKLALQAPVATPSAAEVEAQRLAEAAVEAEKQKIEADARATAEAAAKQKFEDEIRARVLAEIEAKKKLEQEQAATNLAAAQASVVAAAPAAVPTPVEKTATAANTAASAPKPPAGGIEPGSLHGGRSLPTGGAEKKPEYTKQDITRMPKEEMKKRMRDPKFVRLVNELYRPQQS